MAARLLLLALTAVVRLLVATAGQHLAVETPSAKSQSSCMVAWGRPLGNVMTEHESAVVADAVANRKSIITGGASATGKNTLLNAMLALIPADAQVVMIKDTAELQPGPEQNIIQRLATSRADLKAHGFQSLSSCNEALDLALFIERFRASWQTGCSFFLINTSTNWTKSAVFSTGCKR